MSFTAVTFTTQDFFKTESEKIRARFEDSHNGQAAVRERSDLVDKVTTQLWDSAIESSEELGNVCVVALGGYGRQTLFPCSDVDLLFLSPTSPDEQAQKQIRKLCQDLWDLHLRVSPTTRTLADCGKLHRDNVEFNISLLDCRYICGDKDLFEQLREQIIPKMVARDATELMQRLADLTRARHQKYGQTIFHLEPNIKDCPGGLRDYQVAYWLTLISELEKRVSGPKQRMFYQQRYAKIAAQLWISFRPCDVSCIIGKGETSTGLRTSSNLRPPRLESVLRQRRELVRASGCEVTSGTLARFTGLRFCWMKCLRHARACTGFLKTESRGSPMLIFRWWIAEFSYGSAPRWKTQPWSSVFLNLSLGTD